MSLRRIPLYFFSVALALALSITSMSTDIARASSSNLSLGVFLGGGSYDSDLEAYEQWSGADIDLVVHFLNRENWTEARDTLQWVLRVREQDDRTISLAIPMLVDSGGTLEQGANGDFDSYFREYAQMLVAGGQADAILRIGWESDGDWYRWSARNDPENFRLYFRRIVTTMRSVSGQKFAIDWNTAINSHKDPTQYYPGDQYVDIVSLDAYDRSYSSKVKSPEERWQHMRTRSGGFDWLRNFAAAHGKQIAIPEWGLSDQHTDGESHDNPYYIKKMGEFIAQNDVRYASYFERDNEDRHALADGQYPKGKAEFKLLFANGGPLATSTSTTTVVATTETSLVTNKGDYPTDINDPILEAERDAAGLDACRAARDSLDGTSKQKQAACDEASTTAWKAKKAEQLAIIASGGQPVTSAGYWLLDVEGRVYAFGAANSFSAVSMPAGSSAVELVANPTGTGYWVLGSDGVVRARGQAKHFGDVDRSVLVSGESLVAIAAHPSGDGYWVFTSRGRVLPFGIAKVFGDLLSLTLTGPVIDAVATSAGDGYYMVGSDGGVFAFGAAKFYGSMGGRDLNAAVNGLVVDPDGIGYWLVASDGGVFAFDAQFRGSMGGVALNAPVNTMASYGDGYVMLAADGGAFVFSSLPFFGSLGGQQLPAAITGITTIG